MDKEKTFIMLKPDCINRGLVGDIISRIEKKGYRIEDARMTRLDPKFLYVHYAHIAHEPYFLDVFNYMLAGPVMGLSISGENAVLGIRRLVGATKFEEALPGTIRGDYASSTRNNLIHASDSVETAKTEIERFFKQPAAVSV
jgi:nucleoside-diphosphate kinase